MAYSRSVRPGLFALVALGLLTSCGGGSGSNAGQPDATVSPHADAAGLTDGSTGQPMDGSTGQPMDGSTGQPMDGSTGQPMDGSTLSDAGSTTGGALPDLTLKFLPDAASYDARLYHATTFADLKSTVTSWASSGFVVTTMFADASGYTIVGFRPTGSSVTYDVMVANAANRSTLLSTATSWGSSGYVVTAMGLNSAGCAALAFRPTGSTATYDVKMEHTGDRATFQSAMTSWGSSGYVATGVVDAVFTGLTALGFHNRGSSLTYDVKTNLATSFSAVMSDQSSWGSSGYTITAGASLIGGFEVVGFRPSGSTRTFKTKFDGVTTSSALKTDVSSWGASGYMVNTMMENGSIAILGYNPSK